MSDAYPAPSLATVLWRGARGRCPRCGEGALFEGWHRLAKSCPRCALPLHTREGDTWFFMYMTTGFFTGLFLVIMLIVRPPNAFAGRVALGLSAIALMGLTLPLRKGLAIAIDYYVDRAL